MPELQFALRITRSATEAVFLLKKKKKKMPKLPEIKRSVRARIRGRKPSEYRSETR